MQPRLKRYQQFIEQEYIASLTKNKDYSLVGLQNGLKQKIEQGHFKRLVFMGMGCSAIVSEMIKCFFIEQKISLSIEVINDYEFKYLIADKILSDSQTLFIINSFAGNSEEPIKFYEQIKKTTKNIIFLTSGGKLEKIAKRDKISLIYWQLKKPEKKYSVLHAPQFFVILLDIFSQLQLIPKNYEKDILKIAKYLKKNFSCQKIAQAKQLAEKLKDREIIFLANPRWHLMLLRLLTMHFQELAMIPAHRNYFNEFTHCEVAIFTQPKIKLAAAIFVDKKTDFYTKNKIENLIKVLNADKKQNKNIELLVIKMEQRDFLAQFFYHLLFMQYVAYFLAVYYNIEAKDLVAQTSGNH